jgi:biopolymer transport protein TolR
MAEINVVPYIDVMLVLLVIFMVTAPLLKEGVKVDLPQSAAKPLEETATPPVVVKVDAKGDYFIKVGIEAEQRVDSAALAAQAAAVLRLHPDIQVLVAGDRGVSYGAVVTVMSLLQQAGAPSVGLMTETPQQPAERKEQTPEQIPKQVQKQAPGP